MSTEQPPEWKPVPPYLRVNDAKRPNLVNGQKVPRLPFENWLDESGNLIRLAMASTRNFKGAAEGGGDPNRTISWNRSRALKESKIPWAYANARRYAPWLVGSMSEADWNTWREEELQRRRAKHADESVQYQGAWKAREASQADALVQAMAKIVGARDGGGR